MFSLIKYTCLVTLLYLNELQFSAFSESGVTSLVNTKLLSRLKIAMLFCIGSVGYDCNSCPLTKTIFSKV